MEENKTEEKVVVDGVEMTAKEAEKKAKAEARVLAYQNARTLVRANSDAIFSALSEHEFFDEELADALKLLIGSTRTASGRRAPKTGEARITKLDIILGQFNGVGTQCSDVDIYLAGRSKKLAMGTNEIKHQIVKLAKDKKVFIDIEENEEGFVYTYLGALDEVPTLHYELSL